MINAYLTIAFGTECLVETIFSTNWKEQLINEDASDIFIYFDGEAKFISFDFKLERFNKISTMTISLIENNSNLRGYGCFSDQNPQGVFNVKFSAKSIPQKEEEREFYNQFKKLTALTLAKLFNKEDLLPIIEKTECVGDMSDFMIRVFQTSEYESKNDTINSNIFQVERVKI
jgi:hypothetical protein